MILGDGCLCPFVSILGGKFCCELVVLDSIEYVCIQHVQMKLLHSRQFPDRHRSGPVAAQEVE